MENRWLDTIRVLAWHPALAQQAVMQSVCCEQHLKTLLTHWLAHANLHLLATESRAWVGGNHAGGSESEAGHALGGKLVGELSVHREALSRVWTGSPEALECILDELVQGLGPKPSADVFEPTSCPEPTYAS